MPFIDFASQALGRRVRNPWESPLKTALYSFPQLFKKTQAAAAGTTLPPPPPIQPKTREAPPGEQSVAVSELGALKSRTAGTQVNRGAAALKPPTSGQKDGTVTSDPPPPLPNPPPPLPNPAPPLPNPAQAGIGNQDPNRPGAATIGRDGLTGPVLSAQTAQPAPLPAPVASDTEAQRKALETRVLGLLGPTEETQTEKDLAAISARQAAIEAAAGTGKVTVADQPIEMGFITGQQAAIERRAQAALASEAAKAVPLQTRLAQEQMRRQAERDRATAELGFEEARIGRAEAVTAATATKAEQLRKEQFELQKEREKPIGVSEGETVVRYNDATKKYETIATGKPKRETGMVGEYQFYAEQEQASGRKPLSFDDYQTRDANRKARIASAAGSAGLSVGEANLALRLSDDYEAVSKNYKLITDAYGRITAAASQPTAAGDLSFIFAYMKMLDPTSVVREGEQASAQNTAGVPDRIRNLYNKALKGRRLTENQRADFSSQANALFMEAQKEQRRINAEFNGRATQLGLPANVVVRNIGGLDPSAGEVDVSDLNMKF